MSVKKIIKSSTLICILAIIVLSCNSSTDMQNKSANILPESERVVLYQVMTRLFGNTNTNNVPWGTVEENGVGKFNDFTDQALSAIKSQGYTHIWFTGVIEHAVLTDYAAYGIPLDDADVVKGRAGSPYAIKDYYDVNPDLAVDVKNRIKEFEELIHRSKKAGLKVIIDFVPNHVARSYRSDAKPDGVKDFGQDDDTSKAFDPNNNFYYLPGTSFQVPQGYESLGPHSFPTKDGGFEEVPAKVSGNDVFTASPSVYDWFETVKLNYGVDYLDNRRTYFDSIPDTWLKTRDILLYWAAKGIDGFRCDMAEMVPVAYWNWVTRELKSAYPNIKFIAEIYNPNAYREYVFTGGFDYLYDKVELYDTLKSIIQNRASTDDISVIWQRQEGLEHHMLRFLENHDEQRIASPFFAGKAEMGIPMMAVSAFMHRGPVMMYFGQEVGEPGEGVSGFSGNDGRTTIFDYWGVPEHIKWMNNGKFDGSGLSSEQIDLQARYVKILKTINQNKAIKDGSFYDLHYYNRNAEYQGYSNKVYCFLRHLEHEVYLILVNFNQDSEMARVKIPQHAWSIVGINSADLEIADDDTFNLIKRHSTMDYQIPSELKINIPALDYKIIQIKPRN